MVRLKVSVKIEGMAELYTFQFLMVRLKEYYAIQKIKDIYISIPYGAIKRYACII